MKRREFIWTTAIGTAGALWLSSCGMQSSQKSIGLQIYTIRDLFSKDVKGTLELLAKIGYKELEVWGYNDGNILGRRYTEFAKEIKQAGMTLVSGHFDTGFSDPKQQGTLLNGWQRAVDDAKAAGQPYMIIAWLYEEERNSIDAIKRTCDRLNKGGELCQKSGVRLGFHNHLNESARIDNQILYDVMLKELDPKYVAMELDLYWLMLGGGDPLEYIKIYPGRFELWHVKDMDKTDRTKTIEVGSGSMDFNAIFAQAEASGMKHFFVEQENFTGPAEVSIKKSFDYLQSLDAHR